MRERKTAVSCAECGCVMVVLMREDGTHLSNDDCWTSGKPVCEHHQFVGIPHEYL